MNGIFRRKLLIQPVPPNIIIKPEPEGQRKILIFIQKLRTVKDAEKRDHLQDIGHRRDQEIRINRQANQ